MGVIVENLEEITAYINFLLSVQNDRSQCFQLTRKELDMLIFLLMSDYSETTSTEWRHTPSMWSRIHCSFYHQGKSICIRTFLFLHTIGIKRYKNISKSFHNDGILPRIYDNTKRLPWNHLSLTSI